MAVRVVPTLAFMADVYRLPTDGGRDSERFRAYVRAADERRPVHGYNPMTTKAVLPTVEALLTIDAEARLAEILEPILAELGAGGDHEVHVTVAAPGIWTDALATTAEHRLLARDVHGLLWWYDQLVTPDGFDAAARAQAVRLARFLAAGPPTTLADAVDQEGRALARGGALGGFDATAAEVLEVLAADEALGTKVAFLWGDDAATALGFTPLGLERRAGERHAVALAVAKSRG